ncbi:MAG: hypothetical protein A3208_03080 [Candidatus Methanoprimaticola hominis]|nr:MAG: hypothetical protein A3208_03080 [Methanomassiliicoccales archaeon Mx-06]
MMRIAMMTDSWFPTRDGVVTSITIIKESLEALGHEVFIVAPEPEKEFRQEGVYYFPAVRFRSYEGYYVPILPSNKMEVLREIDPDVIHIHGVATMALRGLVCGHELGIPTVMTFHTMVDDAAKYYSPIKIPPETMEKLIWIYLRQILKRMDVVVTPTACIGEELKSRGAVCRNLVTIPTGTNTAEFHPGIASDDIRRRHGLEGKRVAIHVGRISYEKELDMVVRAMQRIDATLLVAGKGPAKADVEKLVEDLGLQDKVVFAGFVPDSELPAYYNAADIAVRDAGTVHPGSHGIREARGLPQRQGIRRDRARRSERIPVRRCGRVRRSDGEGVRCSPRGQGGFAEDGAGQLPR